MSGEALIGRTPKQFEVERGHKTESYRIAVQSNVIPPPVAYDKGKETSEPRVLLLDDSKQKETASFDLTVEELEKYRTDSKWRIFRLILAILATLLWILLFMSCLIVVYFTPPCIEKDPPHWWQSAIAYNIWTPSFQDSDGNGLGDFQGLADRLENLRKIGVEAIWPQPFLLSDSFTDAIRDFNAVDSKLGTNQDADKLIERIHDKNMKIIITVPVSVTSKEHDWFLRSSTASLDENKKFKSYYVWRRDSINNSYITPYKNTSYHYMHIKDIPDLPVLNWKDNSVREEMFKAFSYWIDKGIDGFHLSRVDYIARLTDLNRPDWSAIDDVLRDIRDYVDNYANESEIAKDKKIVLFAHREDADEDAKLEMVENGLDSLVNYELSNIAHGSETCRDGVNGSIAGCVHEILEDVLQFHQKHNVTATWEFGNAFISRLSTRIKSKPDSELLSLLLLSLPGASSFYYGEEIGMEDLPLNSSSQFPPHRSAMQWDDSENSGFSSASQTLIPVNPNYKELNWKNQHNERKSYLKVLKRMGRLKRIDETLKLGHSYIGKMNDNAFLLVRYMENEGAIVGAVYVTAVNFGTSPAELSIKDVDQLKKVDISRAEVIIPTSNEYSYFMRQLLDLSSGSLVISPQSGVVLKFKA